MNKIYKVGGAILGGAALISAGILGGFVMDNPEVINVVQTVEVEKEVFVEVPINVEVEKLVEVLVDNGDMAWAFDRMEDKSIISDASEILAELKAEDNALSMALSELGNTEKLFDMLEEENLIVDEDEVSIIRTFSDFEDVNITVSNFDDEEYSFDIRLKIEDLKDEEKKYIIATVAIEDSEAELLNVRIE